MVSTVRLATPKDAVYLSNNLRAEDLEEIQSSHNIDPLEGLLECFQLKNSQNYAAINENKECVAMFGVSDCPFVEGFGVVWLLSSDAIQVEKRQFVRESRQWVSQLNNKYSTIYNWVHPNNWKTLKWLQFCGFEPRLKHEYGVNNDEFILIMRTKNV